MSESRVPFALAAILAAFAVAVLFYTMAVPRHPRVVPILHVESPAHAGCREIVQRTLWACPDGRAYNVDRHGWHDAGPLTPLPRVPRS